MIGKNKCFRYWPEKMYNAKADIGQLVFDPITVYVKGGSRLDGVLTTDLLLKKGDEVRLLNDLKFSSAHEFCRATLSFLLLYFIFSSAITLLAILSFL
jgi:hypothetical protein